MVDTDGKVTGAAGFLVQAMPDATEDVLKTIEQNLPIVASPSQLAEEGISAAGIIRLLLTGLFGTVYDAEPVQFRCTCSKERVTSVLSSLGRDELDSMVAEGQSEVRCNFCNEAYQFEAEELKKIASL